VIPPHLGDFESEDGPKYVFHCLKELRRNLNVVSGFTSLVELIRNSRVPAVAAEEVPVTRVPATEVQTVATPTYPSPGYGQRLPIHD
jgi:hypothetical protein